MTVEQARHRPVTGLLASAVPVVVPVALVVALVAGVLLVRGDVAADPATFTQPSAAPTDPPSGTVDERAAPPDAALVAAAFADLTGLSLGASARTEAEAAGLVVDAAVDAAGCRAVRASPQDDEVRGWARGGWLTSVALRRTGSDGTALPLRAWVGEPTSDLLESAATSAAAVEELVVVRREDLQLRVRVVTVDLPGTQLLLSDLGVEGGHRWAELRQPAGRRCEQAPGQARRVGGAGPVVGPGGAAGLGFGTPLEAVLEDAVVTVAQQSGGTAGCAVLPVVDGPAGITSLVVADGTVVGLGLDAGGVSSPDGAVLAVGDDLGRVRTVFPDAVGEDELQSLRDNSGVVVPTDGGRVVVSVARASAVVPDVDALAEGPDLLVSSLQVSRGC